WLDHAAMLAVAAAGRAAHHGDQLVDGALEVVVLDHVVEQERLAKLALGEIEPLADLACTLSRPFTQPALELRPRRRHEHGDDAGELLRDLERALRLELEHRDAPFPADPVDLRSKSSVALAGDVRDVLEKLAVRDPAGE